MDTQNDDTERMHSHLAERVRERRRQLGITQQELAQRANLGLPQIVSAIELGEREIKASELFALARALHCNPNALFETTAEPAVVAWRKRPEAGAAIEEARFLEFCENYRLVEAWTQQGSEAVLPSIKRPQGAPSFEWASAEAARVRDSLSLGRLPAASLLRTLEEQCGVKVFFLPDLHGSAASACGSFGKAIALNADEVPWRRNFSLAHELFHLLTWGFLSPKKADTVTTWPDRIEQLADVFASALLLPADALLEHIKQPKEAYKHQVPLRRLIDVARAFDVSTAALLWRLVSLGHMKKAIVEGLLADSSFLREDSAAFGPLSPPERLPSRFLRLLETAYLKGEVSVGRVAEMLGQSLPETRQQLLQLEEDKSGAERLVRLA